MLFWPLGLLTRACIPSLHGASLSSGSGRLQSKRSDRPQEEAEGDKEKPGKRTEERREDAGKEEHIFGCGG